MQETYLSKKADNFKKKTRRFLKPKKANFTNHVIHKILFFFLFPDDLAVNITQDPRLETYPTGRQVEVNLGGSVQLQCPEEAMGCWSRVGANGRLEPVGPGPSLALSNIIYQDAGEYRCVSSKREYDRWRSEVNVDVTVKGKRVSLTFSFFFILFGT